MGDSVSDIGGGSLANEVPVSSFLFMLSVIGLFSILNVTVEMVSRALSPSSLVINVVCTSVVVCVSAVVESSIVVVSSPPSPNLLTAAPTIICRATCSKIFDILFLSHCVSSSPNKQSTLLSQCRFLGRHFNVLLH